MRENMNTNEVVAVKRGRGRPAFSLQMPEKSPFTITDIQVLNNCSRLTVYNQIEDGKLKIHATGETRPCNGPGKPGDLFVSVEAWKRSQAAKKAAKTRKMNAKVADAAPVALVTPLVADATPVTA